MSTRNTHHCTPGYASPVPAVERIGCPPRLATRVKAKPGQTLVGFSLTADTHAPLNLPFVRESLRNDFLRFLLNSLQVIFAEKTLRVEFVNFLGA